MISSFRGRWIRLSNYAICSIWFEDHIYGSVEHAYQAAKTLSATHRKLIRHTSTPNEAKKAGRTVQLREDWETVKIDIMRSLLWEKFSQDSDRAVLLATGDEVLVEGNWWGDRFWGECPLGEGKNWLGRLLMETRARLIEETAI